MTTRSVRLNGARIRQWISFGVDESGTYAPQVDTSTLPKELKKLAKKVNVAARSASFKTSGAKITGVLPSREGKAMDVDATAAEIEALLAGRAAGSADAEQMKAVMTVIRPKLTTSQARQVIPKMRKVSEWTTYFPIAEKNAFGANIWIPAMDLDGHVVAPGDTFDFWKSIGPVTRARGYRDGGAIINGRTELQGALAGGICSTSTTLFNAALRAGYEMGARRNHYYYIDRYPLGLDATVFKSGSSTQTMEFTNDTRYPILIRAYKIRERRLGVREVRAVQRADRSQGLVQQAHREELPARQRHDPVHVVAAEGRIGAGRVPGRRQAGLGDPHRPQERRGPPQGDLLLELRADHRDHAGRSLGRSGPQASASGSFM